MLLLNLGQHRVDPRYNCRIERVRKDAQILRLQTLPLLTHLRARLVIEDCRPAVCGYGTIFAFIGRSKLPLASHDCQT